MEAIAISDNFSRFKDASWFPKIKGRDILLVGCGGIGSVLGLLLARTGANLYLYDEDIVEAHNTSGQLYQNKDTGKMKIACLLETIQKFCDSGVSVETFEEMYNEYSPSNPVVLSGLDNMKGRRNVYNNWIKWLKNNPEQTNEAILIDGRLNMEQLQIYCIKGNDKKAQENYAKDALFDDSEVQEQQCSLKQTSHAAFMIASFMTSFLCNFYGEDFREVPYFFQYSLPIHLFTDSDN